MEINSGQISVPLLQISIGSIHLLRRCLHHHVLHRGHHLVASGFGIGCVRLHVRLHHLPLIAIDIDDDRGLHPAKRTDIFHRVPI